MIRALVAMETDTAWDDLPPGVELRFCAGDVETIDAELDDSVEILMTDAMPSSDAHCGGLRWLQLMSAGTDQLRGHPLMRHDIRIANAAGSSATHIAEFVVGRVLYHTKEFQAFAEFQRRQHWPNRLAMARPGLAGQLAVIIGYGGVGRETARLLSAFGMRIVAVAREPRRTPYLGYAPTPTFGDPDATLPERIVTLAELPDVLPDADVVVLAVPHTSATHHLINAALLAHTKPSAILINIARGKIVDTQALLQGLDDGRLAHAYLDVFEQEPLPPGSPVWTHPRISYTAHMSGVLPDPTPVLQDLFRRNLRRYLDREPLINQVDRQRFL